MSDWVATRGRKAGHLRIALEDGGRIDRGAAASGFDQLRFIPNALPEIDLWEIDTSSTVFGRRLGAPLLISSMTGGTEEAGRLNRILAESAQKFRVAMGLGSARGLLAKIGALTRALHVPVVVKEVGFGLAPDVVVRLLDAGVAAVDVAGAGGTSWSEVERHRMGEPWRQRMAGAFAGWGVPT